MVLQPMSFVTTRYLIPVVFFYLYREERIVEEMCLRWKEASVAMKNKMPFWLTNFKTMVQKEEFYQLCSDSAAMYLYNRLGGTHYRYYACALQCRDSRYDRCRGMQYLHSVYNCFVYYNGWFVPLVSQSIFLLDRCIIINSTLCIAPLPTSLFATVLVSLKFLV